MCSNKRWNKHVCSECVSQSQFGQQCTDNLHGRIGECIIIIRGNSSDCHSWWFGRHLWPRTIYEYICNDCSGGRTEHGNGNLCIFLFLFGTFSFIIHYYVFCLSSSSSASPLSSHKNTHIHNACEREESTQLFLLWHCIQLRMFCSQILMRFVLFGCFECVCARGSGHARCSYAKKKPLRRRCSFFAVFGSIDANKMHYVVASPRVHLVHACTSDDGAANAQCILNEAVCLIQCERAFVNGDFCFFVSLFAIRAATGTTDCQYGSVQSTL